MDPNRPAWALRLSKLHYQKKDIKAAAAAIRTLPLEAYAPAWCSYIAMCFWRSGAPIEAKNAVRRALDGSQERNSTLEAMEAEISRQMADSNLSSSAGELSSEFYDKSYSGAKLYTLEAEATSYVGTWERIVRRLQKDQARSVLDIGCGPGQFAEFLKKRIPNVSYTGVDFSEVAISMARQRCPDGLFLVHDVVRGGALNVDYDAVVCTEVLEHIANDFAVFENLRVGSLFIGTVPNFDSFGHVRYFTSEQEIRDRYSGCLDQIEVDKAVVNDSAVLFIISGRIPSRGAD
jgi:SAM-dependent methyltransferase